MRDEVVGLGHVRRAVLVLRHLVARVGDLFEGDVEVEVDGTLLVPEGGRDLGEGVSPDGVALDDERFPLRHGQDVLAGHLLIEVNVGGHDDVDGGDSPRVVDLVVDHAERAGVLPGILCGNSIG